MKTEITWVDVRDYCQDELDNQGYDNAAEIAHKMADDLYPNNCEWSDDAVLRHVHVDDDVFSNALAKAVILA